MAAAFITGNIFAGAAIGAFAATVSLVDSIATAVIVKNGERDKTRRDAWFDDYRQKIGAVVLVNLLAFPLLGFFPVNVLAAGLFIFIGDVFRGRLETPDPINQARTIFLI